MTDPTAAAGEHANVPELISPASRAGVRLAMSEDTLLVFSSQQPDFGMLCEIRIDDGEASCYLDMTQTAPGGIAADDIAALAEATGRLRDWLADCEALARWSTDHARELWEDCARSGPVVSHIIDRGELERQGHTRALCGEPFSAGDEYRPGKGSRRTRVICPACEATAMLRGWLFNLS